MSDDVTSNADTVTARFAAAAGSLAPTQEIARELATLIGTMMHDRCMREIAPDGSPWDALEESTIRRKGHDTIGIDTGEMLDLENFTSLYDIIDDTVQLTYAGPSEKLGWFQGDNNYGKARVAWGLDPEIEVAIMRFIGDYYRTRWREIRDRGMI